MASYPNPQREPLIDTRLQATLTQRGKELLGLGLMTLAFLMALVLGSWSPDDPSWMAATDAPVHNALGRGGAAVAAPVVLIAGKAGWGLVLALAVWGLRLVIHRGENNILGRTLFVPIAVAVAAVWLATLVPGAGWQRDFGLGGMFGDTILGALLTALPIASPAAFNLLTLALFVVTLALWAYVLGSTWAEVGALGRFLLTGLILSYAGLVSALAGGWRGAGTLAGHAQGQMAARRAARTEAAARGVWDAPAPADWGQAPHWPPAEAGLPAEPPISGPRGNRVLRADPPLVAGHAPAMQPAIPAPMPPTLAPTLAPTQPPLVAVAPNPPRTGGLLARVQALGRRAPDPELIEPALASAQPAPTEDRIRSRISDAIRARATQPPAPLMVPPHAALPIPAAQPPRMEPPRADAGRMEPLLRAEPVLRAGPILSVPGGSSAHPGPAPIAPAPIAPARVEPAQPASAGAAYPPTRPVSSAAPPVPVWTDPDDEIDDDDILLDPPPRRADVPEPGLTRRVVQTALRRTTLPSKQARAEAQPKLPFDQPQAQYELPPLGLLADPSRVERYSLSDDALEENARMLESVLDDYGVRGEIVAVRPGPVVTLYELEPAPGLKASRVIGLSDDIARSMSALSARVSTVPGRSVIGIELPNARREKVVLREILGARDFGDTQMRLPLALGKDIGGEPIIANLAKMPHLLIAGTTGSGKSVAINTMILSLLYKLTPAECRLIMIDPKMLELSVYDGIPHLLSPVVTDPKKAVVALKWVVGEMEERYRKMSKMGVRNIDGYNSRVRDALSRGEMFKRTVQTGFDDETGDPVFETEEFAPELLPFIVVIVDEMADLMMVAGKEIEACIQRLAQMARASGIHLIMATQRPSVDVITGTIKANFPTRISFQVTSKIDSRTILGEQGAEQLLGMGDMLYMAGGSKITRIHGPFVSDEEVEEIVRHLKSWGPPEYQSGVLDAPDGEREADIDAVLGLGGEGGDDALYDQAVAIVAKDRKCSTSYIQRKLGIGYNKAARLVEQMEDQGVVSPANHVGKREVLVPEV